MRLHRSLLLLGAVLAAGCGGGDGNPFAAFSRNELPDDETDLIFVSNLHDPASPLREVFALDVDGGGEPQQLTFCTTGEERQCDALGAAMAPDRRRLAVRRIDGDLDRDGDLDVEDGVALYVVDLERNLDALFVELQGRVSGVDWLPRTDLLVYSARTPLGQGAPGIGADDIYRITGRRQEQFNLTDSPPLLERNPRINPGGNVAIYERTIPVGDATDIVSLVTDPVGVSEIWIFQSSTNQLQVTAHPDPGGARVPGTTYLVGSDADPVFSPDEAQVAYRRLTGLGSGAGSWDLLAQDIETGTERSLASGSAYRSGPDWSTRGVVYAESDAESTRLLLLEPETGAIQVLLTLAPEVRIDGPRWMVPAATP